MPVPRKIVIPKVPKFSELVGSNAPAALTSPLKHENASITEQWQSPEQQKFNPRVAVYTAAFVGVLIGGLFVGFKSREIMDYKKVML
jgi:hypothetical protein